MGTLSGRINNCRATPLEHSRLRFEENIFIVTCTEHAHFYKQQRTGQQELPSLVGGVRNNAERERHGLYAAKSG